MKHTRYRFSSASTDFYFDGKISRLKKIVRPEQAVIITDQNIYDAHSGKFTQWDTIVLKAGEEHKVQETVDEVIEQLIEFGADRQTVLIGVGGGVITDITGYVASVYMRGIKFGFIPTSLLAMVDAAIGGKNGIDVGVYKNMVGVIRQPSFLLYDFSLLESLPANEWRNGFAEIIKHASIKDASMFRQLEDSTPEAFMGVHKSIAELVIRNAKLKIKVVREDEFEKDTRRLLNFGHTLGHALENQYELSHGEAVAIGMTYASMVSETVAGFKGAARVIGAISQYGLPTFVAFDKEKVFKVMTMDKKRERKEMNYVLLEKIGKGIVKPISVKRLEKIISEI
ncbi:MAG: 3-dehydroquinate synthase [Chitinophagaceae bacterium]|nr:3-dehydroquinate synthase [Chitinophagaceae bacterium]